MDYARFRFFDLTKNNLVNSIIYLVHGTLGRYRFPPNIINFITRVQKTGKKRWFGFPSVRVVLK